MERDHEDIKRHLKNIVLAMNILELQFEHLSRYEIPHMIKAQNEFNNVRRTFEDIIECMDQA
jgi:hypothetical protein